MRSFLVLTLTFGMLATSLGCWPSDGFLERHHASQPEQDAGLVQSTLATLYTNDPMRNGYDFERSDYGTVIQNGQVKNGGTHIVYGTYAPHDFSVGVQGGDTGVILDLGTDQDVATRIGASQTVGGGQGYAGLTRTGEHFNDSEADKLFTIAPTSDAEAAAVLGHLYLLRITRADKTDLIVKLLVVSLDSDASVAFQWIRLP